MTETQFEYLSDSKFKLAGRIWRVNPSARGIICLVHGFGEHCGRYQHVAASFNEEGYHVIAMDLNGHGVSSGKRGDTPSYDTWLNEVDLLIERAKFQAPGLKMFLYGHSLGGGLVLNDLLRRDPKVDGAIVTSPLLRLTFKPALLKIGFAHVMRYIYPSLTVSNNLAAWGISHNPHVVEDYLQDPLVHDRVSARAFIAFVKAGEYALKNAYKLKIPILLLHGIADPITDWRASNAFAAVAGRSCTFRTYEGLYHELHNESEWPRIFQEILAWIQDIKFH